MASENPMVDNVNLLNTLLSTFVGKPAQTTTTSGGSSTQQTQFTPEAVQALLSQMMGSSSGLASVSSGQRSAGMYNSTTNQQLVNDLLTRVSGDVAVRTAPAVTTKEPTTQTIKTPAAVGNTGKLLTLGALLFGNKDAKGKMKDVWSQLFGDGTTPGSIDLNSFDSLPMMSPDVGASTSLDQMIGNFDQFPYSAPEADLSGYFDSIAQSTPLDFSSLSFTDGTGGLGDAIGMEGNTPDSVMDVGISDWFSSTPTSAGGQDLFSGLGDTTADITAGTDAAGSWFKPVGAAMQAYGVMSADTDYQAAQAIKGAALNYIPVAGPIIAGINSLTDGAIVSAADDASYDIPNFAGEIGDKVTEASLNWEREAGEKVLDEVGGFFRDIGDSIGCFITTAVCEIYGKPDDCYELETLRDFRDTWMKEHFPQDIELYYREAPGIVAALKARGDSKVIFRAFYKEYLVPAINAIEQGQEEMAHRIYTSLFELAKALAVSTKEGF